ncbi:hypothetical protein QBC34DRAFT_431900 [Podospora aff. communis PSN243]|uniref:CCHC-type domain-containing protein n=1 Tax=Podospora aff. communis PSN243 TaxID=3040156 RepID=A0AAV9G3U0_9PEZI|nr:hypothetical protein QBC34DRAFT_431900 [Podospora aff. communis PSN243]
MSDHFNHGTKGIDFAKAVMAPPNGAESNNKRRRTGPADYDPDSAARALSDHMQQLRLSSLSKDVAWTPETALPSTTRMRAFLPAVHTNISASIPADWNVTSNASQDAVFLGTSGNNFAGALVATPEMVGALGNSILHAAHNAGKGYVKVAFKVVDIPTPRSADEALPVVKTGVRNPEGRKPAGHGSNLNWVKRSGTDFSDPTKQLIAKGRSHCTRCNQTGHWKDQCYSPFGGPLIACPLYKCREKRFHCLDRCPEIFPCGGRTYNKGDNEKMEKRLATALILSRARMCAVRSENFSHIDYIPVVYNGLTEEQRDSQAEMPNTDEWTAQLAGMDSGDPQLRGKLHPKDFVHGTHTTADLPLDPYWEGKTWRKVFSMYTYRRLNRLRWVSERARVTALGGAGVDPVYAAARKYLIHWVQGLENPEFLLYTADDGKILMEVDSTKENNAELSATPAANPDANPVVEAASQVEVDRNGVYRRKAQFVIRAPGVAKYAQELLLQWFEGKLSPETLDRNDPVKRAVCDLMDGKFTFRVRSIPPLQPRAAPTGHKTAKAKKTRDELLAEELEKAAQYEFQWHILSKRKPGGDEDKDSDSESEADAQVERMTATLSLDSEAEPEGQAQAAQPPGQAADVMEGLE